MYFKLITLEGIAFNRLIANNPKQAVKIASMIEPDPTKEFEIVQITHEEFHSMEKIPTKQPE